uniref:Lipocalin n=1 Tax=Rhipicephalus appendiculatus TaxID=34631 RepID=A0A131YSM7_RHIAP
MTLLRPDINMKLLLLILALGVVFCQAEEEKNPGWADEKKFGGYQNASKSLQRYARSTYYLTNATYNNDTVWGNNFNCLFMAPNKDSAKNESVQVTITYRNGENRTWLKSNETLTAINMYNYKMKNAIKFQTHGASVKTFNDALVYTDGEYCNIFYTTNGSSDGKQQGGYELWMAEKKVNQIPRLCELLFTALTEGMSRHIIWTRSCDSNP